MQNNRIYRVVCSKLRHSDETFIDIAPTDANRFGVTHEMLFYSRMKLVGDMLTEYGIGSIFLRENDWHDPEVDFSQGFHARKGTLEYESYEKMCESVRSKIVQTFKQMRADGNTSTLRYIMSVPEVEAYKEHIAARHGQLSEADGFEAREKRKRQKFAEKHKDLLKSQDNTQNYVASYEEEQVLHRREEFDAAERRRQNKLEDMSSVKESEDVITVMRRKMKMYDGD